MRMGGVSRAENSLGISWYILAYPYTATRALLLLQVVLHETASSQTSVIQNRAETILDPSFWPFYSKRVVA